jgi:hypothetical protein
MNGKNPLPSMRAAQTLGPSRFVQPRLPSPRSRSQPIQLLKRDLITQLVAGTLDVRDEVLGLSEGQAQIVEAMVQQLRQLEELQAHLRELERAREEMLPKPIPLESLIPFQPDFVPLEEQGELQIHGLSESYAAVAKVAQFAALSAGFGNLPDILKSGLSPSAKGAIRSGDLSQLKVVSVNVASPSKGNPDRIAHYLTLNAANGALPVALERYGDDGSTSKKELSIRAITSALIIIDPRDLSKESVQQVQRTSDGGGGELGLSDSIPASSFVAILLPAVFKGVSINGLDSDKVHYVGMVNGPVRYNFHGKSGMESRSVDLDHPGYEEALNRILRLNPDKTLLTHVTRLGK